MIDLTGKTALVTGGTRGIGKAIVEALVQAGAKVVFTGSSAESAEKAMVAFAESGIHTFGLGGDVSDPEQAQKVVDLSLEYLEKIDILVNNAGITKDQLFMKMKREDWDQVMDTNLGGVFNVTKAVIKPMLKARYGRIINLGSVVGSTGNPGQVNYSASKAGLIGLSKSLAKELGGRNITCNVIAPGFIATDMTEQLPEAQKDTLISQIALGRLGEGKDIAGAVLYLASPLADYVTGTVLHVNGGMY
ncbi:MAG: 3-oxoacyl-[acyl-carrier-protein] reductase [Candidatus Lambdaproteobacteria bacterium RIFOXYD12_FULL_49_8]|uniref:3-oxoacyl-[acyl-carrier-protein] reductase n=1 Tax=Candidatus Lambdaproteobacteria bacterium RIFOXYD2_FULL_50_16 TaxID=1817772 RepID=A0A1F6G5C2_9PROT|nr:MAG: 3-oxoacyl-[acyl-carrier-protein] reductase [Candidatus Lambdaproteobacteria bacterium RIFOXYD2_FULL_50_16]OGG97446.1 MAG: 3-oxoacyl-[acyl-carrier-protein] reductase [Candidatus Lambdaproteobacteria bacterium RIFOXYD12_FULL_49_8]